MTSQSTLPQINHSKITGSDVAIMSFAFLSYIPMLGVGVYHYDNADLLRQILCQTAAVIGLIIFSLCTILILRFRKESFISFGFPKPRLQYFLRGLALMPIVVIISWLVNVLLYFFYESLNKNVDELQQIVEQALRFPNILIWVVFFGPIIEEVFFRGFLFSYCKKKLGAKKAIWITSIIFGAIHCDLYRFAALTVIGYILALERERTNTLWAPIVTHIGLNSVMMFLVFVGKSILDK